MRLELRRGMASLFRCFNFFFKFFKYFFCFLLHFFIFLLSFFSLTTTDCVYTYVGRIWNDGSVYCTFGTYIIQYWTPTRFLTVVKKENSHRTSTRTEYVFFSSYSAILVGGGFTLNLFSHQANCLWTLKLFFFRLAKIIAKWLSLTSVYLLFFSLFPACNCCKIIILMC